MHKLILLALALGAWITTYATEASAVMCAKGVYRAGCVGPRGAVVGNRAIYPRYGATVVRGTTIHPRGGVAVHRRTVIR
jgi:hypothetical protein